MLNFTITNKLESLLEVGRRYKVVSLLLLSLLVIVFGILPSTQFFWAKCFIAEFAIIVFLSLVFFKNNWIKLIVLCSLFNYIRTMNLGGMYRIIAFNNFYYILLFLVLYQVLSNKIKREDTKIIINGLCIIMLIQLVYMYFQYFGIDLLFKLNSPYTSDRGLLSTTNLVVGFWGHTNISGASLAITLPLFFRRKWWIFTLPIIYMIVVSNSLGSIIASCCAILFYLLFIKKSVLIYCAMILVLLGTIVYGITVDKSQFSFENSRTKLFINSSEMIRRHPIIGYGLGQYKIAYKQIVKNVFDKFQTTTHAHFDFVEWVVDNGWIGGILVLGLLISIFCFFIKNMTYMSLIMISGIVAGLINSCSTFVFHTPLAWIILLLVVLVNKEIKYE